MRIPLPIKKEVETLIKFIFLQKWDAPENSLIFIRVIVLQNLIEPTLKTSFFD